MVKVAILLMVGFDLGLHVYQLLTGQYFVQWAFYDAWWTGYFTLLFMLLLWEFYIRELVTKIRIKWFIKGKRF